MVPKVATCDWGIVMPLRWQRKKFRILVAPPEKGLFRLRKLVVETSLLKLNRQNCHLEDCAGHPEVERLKWHLRWMRVQLEIKCLVFYDKNPHLVQL